jgi:hypothetical protein
MLSEQYKEFYEKTYPRVHKSAHFPIKQMSLENKTLLRNEAKYVRNVCTKCHVAKSVQTQQCLCD